MVITASSERTYMVPASTNTGAGYYVPSSIVVATKSSADVIDYTFDFSTWLTGTFDNVSKVVGLTGPLSPGAYPVTLMDSSVSGSQVTAILASGQPNTTNILGLQVQTTQGRQVTVPFTLTIDNASPATSATPAVPQPTVSKAPVTVINDAAGPITLAPDTQGRDASYIINATGDVTLSVGPTSFTNVRQVIYVKLVKTGTATVTWNFGSTFEWFSNSAPTAPTNDGIIYFQMVTYDGINWVGFQAP